jgi:POT family proton-dependent oligopeptide transporter
VFIAVAALSLAYLIYCATNETTMQARQTMVILLLCIISVMFWAFYFQMFLSLTLFIARVVQPTLFGVQFTPPYYVGIQSFGMIILGLILTRRKHSLKQAQEGIQTGNKFVLALFFTTLAYVLIALVSRSGPTDSLLSPLYIIPAYLMLSIAELLLSPVGLSAITILASPKKVSTMMGIFFVSLGIGGFLSGKLAELTAIPMGETATTVLKAHYAVAFTHLLYILVGATLLCFALNLIIKYLMRKPCPMPKPAGI